MIGLYLRRIIYETSKIGRARHSLCHRQKEMLVPRDGTYKKSMKTYSDIEKGHLLTLCKQRHTKASSYHPSHKSIVDLLVMAAEVYTKRLERY